VAAVDHVAEAPASKGLEAAFRSRTFLRASAAWTAGRGEARHDRSRDHPLALAAAREGGAELLGHADRLVADSEP